MSQGNRKRSSARLGIVLFALAALMCLGVSLTLAAPPFTTTVQVDGVTDFTVTVSGTADSPSNATHHMVIEWGDGNVDTLPNFSGDAPWNWGPVSHTYASAGTFTITATLIHANEHGNDKGAASSSTEVTILGGCTENCPTGGTDDGTTDGTEVLGEKIKKKPAKNLAKTGPETQGLAIVGFTMLLAGVTMRRFSTREEAAGE